MVKRQETRSGGTGPKAVSKGDSKAPGTGRVATQPPARRARPCPICNALAVKAYHPFCSKRCADVDLHRWLAGSYRIPVVEEAPDEGELGGGEEGGSR